MPRASWARVTPHGTLLDGAFLAEGANRLKRAPVAGEVVDGKYRLVRTLGEGGMGIVFEADHLLLREKVAIKFLRPEVVRLPEATARFQREARASVRMRGPHVVHVIDVDSDADGRPYMVMELLRGRDLEAELRERGRLPVAEAAGWLLQACGAVAEAHDAGIVHRDLKPSNLFLAEADGTRVVKVLDFGISKMTQEPELPVTSTTMTFGTPLYMSPEQLRSSRDVDARTDVWALGVILYELVAGMPPFRGTTTAAIAAIVADATPSLSAVRTDTPSGLERVVATALAKSPERRFPNVEAFAAALLPFASRAKAMAGRSGSGRAFRPSLHARRVARSAMARAPIGPLVTDAVDLLRLRPSETPPVIPTPPGATRIYRDAARTFVGAVALGMGLATAASVLVGTAEDPPASRRENAGGDSSSLTSRVALLSRA
ncbi:MAG: serine/threonine protein kinase, partial [Polyangiaceae bacterium]|nr:serine/threonine protein kinase [Polyangiaceae bacterium]